VPLAYMYSMVNGCHSAMRERVQNNMWVMAQRQIQQKLTRAII